MCILYTLQHIILYIYSKLIKEIVLFFVGITCIFTIQCTVLYSEYKTFYYTSNYASHYCSGFL